MNNQMSFTIRQRKSDLLPLRIGDAFTFSVNGSFGISIVYDCFDKFVGFTLMPKSKEVIFGNLSKNYSRFDKVIRIEYQHKVKKEEINLLTDIIYKKLSLNISRQKFKESFVQSIFNLYQLKRERSITISNTCVKKLPFSTEGYDLEGLSVKQLKKLRANVYSVIKGKPATKEDMKFLGFIKKALYIQRDTRD